VTSRLSSPPGPGGGAGRSLSSGSVIYVTLFQAWRSQADGDGRLRSSADTAHRPRAYGRCLRRVDSGYTVDEGAERAPPKVPGYNVQGHRQDHERRSGVELGIRALPAGSDPRQLAQSPESSGLTGASCVPGAGLGPRLAEPTQRPAGAGRDAFREGFQRRPITNAVRRVTMDKLCRSARQSEPDGRCGTQAERHRHARC
jgi:hypothetical protein